MTPDRSGFVFPGARRAFSLVGCLASPFFVSACAPPNVPAEPGVAQIAPLAPTARAEEPREPVGAPDAGVAPAPTEWRIGAYLSLSGAETQFGSETKEGFDLAVDEVNARGGARGRPLRLFYADDRSNAQEAVRQVLRLVQEDHVVALLGEVASSRSRAGGLIATREGIPMLTPSSTHPDVTKVGPFVFRACFTDDRQGRAAATFVRAGLHKSKVAILFTSDDLYSSGLAKDFRDEWAKEGGVISIERSFLHSETNFSGHLTAIRAAGVEVIYAPTYYNVMVLIARQAKALGISGRMFVGGDGWDASSLLADAGAEMEGAHFTNHYALDLPGPKNAAFVAKYNERYAHEPSSLGALGYEAAGLLADAIGRADGDTPLAIRDALAATTGFEGLTGPITMNTDRNPEKRVILLQIKNRKFVHHSSVGGPP